MPWSSKFRVNDHTNVLEKLSGEFQWLLLRHLYHSYKFASDVSPYIKPEYFEENNYAIAFVEWSTLYHKLALPPNEVVMLDYLRSNLQMKRTVRQIFQDGPLPQVEAAYVTEHMKDFIQFQAMRTALMECAQPLLHGDVKAMRDLLQSALQVGLVGQGRDVRYISEVNERMQDDVEDRLLWMMIPQLDRVVEFKRGDLMCALGQPGYGKTHFLLHVATASIIQRKRCVFYSLEMREKTLMRRMDASFAGVPVREVIQERHKVVKRIDQLGVQFGDNLIFRKFPIRGTSTFMIQQHIQSLIAGGFQPEVVCIDYADLLTPIREEGYRKNGNGQDSSHRYYESRDTYVDLLDMADQYDLGMATVCQAHRGFYDLITMNEASESFEKAMKSTIMIGLCQTPEEKRQNKMRLYVTKNRNELSNVIVGIENDFTRGRFYVKDSDQEVEPTQKPERKQKSQFTVNSRKLIPVKE